MFIQLYAKPKNRSWKDAERLLGNFRSLYARPIDQVKRSEIVRALDALLAAEKPYTANRALAAIKKLMSWSLDRGAIEVNPIAGLKPPTKERARERVLTDPEVRALLTIAEREGYPFGNMVELLLQTAQRRGEVAGTLSAERAAFVRLMLLLAPRKTAFARMRWCDVSVKKRQEIIDMQWGWTALDAPAALMVWTTPHELTKSKGTAANKSEDEQRTYLTPLPALAQRELLRIKPKGANPDDLLFPDLPMQETKAGRPVFQGIRLSRRLMKAAELKEFNYHAFRHTIASWLKASGKTLFDRGLVLNHKEAGVTAGYSHGYALRRNLDVLTDWSKHVEKLIPKDKATSRTKQSNVVQFPATVTAG